MWQVRTVQTSLEAQVRSWKSKAEAAERRATEERDKRRELEAGGKGPLAQANTPGLRPLCVGNRTRDPGVALSARGWGGRVRGVGVITSLWAE